MQNAKQIYVAGPMTGFPNFNFEAFHKAAKNLRKKGWIVHNPAEKDEELGLDEEATRDGCAIKATAAGFNFRDAYLWDLTKIVEGDGIYMLKGWEQSPGARGEHAAATAMKKNYPDYEIIYE